MAKRKDNQNHCYHRFSWNWKIADGYPTKGIEQHKSKVFGTFICGGGSTMGCKLAGYEHFGGVEIDPSMAKMYQINHDPKHLFVEDLRLFNQREDLPKQLYELDLLEGSPPCSTFSDSGSREKDWGKKKKFREGQQEQRLDDLLFVYIDTIAKLRPKTAILENVSGLVKGNAKAYVKQIFIRLRKIGYSTQLFVLNGAFMGVPQARTRVFFLARRNDLNLPKIELNFDEPLIPFRDLDVKRNGQYIKHKSRYWYGWQHKTPEDNDMGDVSKRLFGTVNGFNHKIVKNRNVAPTITTGSNYYFDDVPMKLPDDAFIKIGSFPSDYDFLKMKPQYAVGMSVPPLMMAQIAYEIWLQWLRILK